MVIGDIQDQIIGKTPLAFTFNKVIYDDQGQPVDYQLLEVNPAFERHLGLKKSDVTGKNMSEWLLRSKKIRDKWFTAFAELALTGDRKEFKEKLTFNDRCYLLTAFTPYSGYLIVLLYDATEFEKTKTELQKATISLKTSLAFSQRVFDNTPVAIVIYEVKNNGASSADYIIRNVNPACLEIEGWRKENVIGQPIGKIRPGVEEFGIIDVFQQAFETGQTIHYPAQVYREGEELRWFENTIFKLPSGEIVAAYNDITDKRQAEKKLFAEKERLQAILDSLRAGVVLLDETGKIVFINHAWKVFFHYPNFHETDCTGYNIKQLLEKILAGVANRKEVYTRLADLSQDKSSIYSVVLEQKYPVPRFLSLYSHPCTSRAGHNWGRIIAVKDISQRVEVDRLKLELINTVSHELRTPMSSILGFSELLLTRQLAAERQTEYLDIINSEAKRLTELINDFLDIQKMESGKQQFNMQPQPITQIINEAIQLHQNTSTLHNIIYRQDPGEPPPVRCDRDKILQVLSNLLSNAIKYCPGGGEIRVALTRENGKIKISVTDHGLGIPSHAQNKLFQKFYRVECADRNQIGGTGLGLAICKEIIGAHRGEIGFASKHGQGSTFYFTLPL